MQKHMFKNIDLKVKENYMYGPHKNTWIDFIINGLIFEFEFLFKN